MTHTLRRFLLSTVIGVALLGVAVNNFSSVLYDRVVKTWFDATAPTAEHHTSSAHTKADRIPIPVTKLPKPVPAPVAAEPAPEEALEAGAVLGSYEGVAPPNSIVIDKGQALLLYVLPNNRALQYRLKIGVDCEALQGTVQVVSKTEWPDWRPSALRRQPYLPKFMAGGEGNPLGARSIGLSTNIDGIHGGIWQSQPRGNPTGCFGMRNDSVADLFQRVKVGDLIVIE